MTYYSLSNLAVLLCTLPCTLPHPPNSQKRGGRRGYIKLNNQQSKIKRLYIPSDTIHSHLMHKYVCFFPTHRQSSPMPYGLPLKVMLEKIGISLVLEKFFQDGWELELQTAYFFQHCIKETENGHYKLKNFFYSCKLFLS